MKLLKYPVFNKVLKFFYHAWNSIDQSLRKTFFNKVRVSGVARINLDELSFKMYSACDDGIVDMLYFRDRKYNEISEIKLFKVLAAQAQTVLDIGANTGLYTIVCKLKNPSAKVYSFEPYSVNRERLKKNLSLNQLDETGIIGKAVGSEVGVLEFAVPENDRICDVLSADIEFTNTFYRESINYKNISVEQVSLDFFAEQEKLSSVDLIKIDVENFELNVFLGGLKLLEKTNPIILVEIFVEEDKTVFYEKYLKPLGYYCYLIIEEGLVRISTLIYNPNCRNFIFSKKKSSTEYLPFNDMDKLISEIRD